jgi:endonuclease YncB( thermonuclease family)
MYDTGEGVVRFLAFTAPAQAGETIAVRVISVYAGDTFTANAIPWPGATIRALVRVDGVDTPSIDRKCIHSSRFGSSGWSCFASMSERATVFGA